VNLQTLLEKTDLMSLTKFSNILALITAVTTCASAALAATIDSDSNLDSLSKSSPAASKTDIPRGKGRPRIGLALGGGGARGAAHVGVLKVLTEEGIPIDYVAGTSIGSVVGGLYCAGVPLDEMSQLFEDGKLMKEFTPLPLALRIVLAPVIFTPRLFGAKPYDGLYKGVQFRNYVDGLLERSKSNIEQLPIPFSAVCTNVVEGQSERVYKGSLATAMQASTAVPGLRKPVEIADHLYCDGGLVCNVPVPQVKEMGADFVIAVDIDETLKPAPLDSFRVPGSMSKQALRIQLATGDSPLCKEADVVIHPNLNGITLISRKASDGRKGVESGIKAAREAMPELKRKLAALGVQLATKQTAAQKP
jgi:NTE family protein